MSDSLVVVLDNSSDEDDDSSKRRTEASIASAEIATDSASRTKRKRRDESLTSVGAVDGSHDDDGSTVIEHAGSPQRRSLRPTLGLKASQTDSNDGDSSSDAHHSISPLQRLTAV
jgi:hypothetical protein